MALDIPADESNSGIGIENHKNPMDRQSLVALLAFGLAALLGLAGNVLLRVDNWGFNTFLSALLLTAGVHLLVSRLQLQHRSTVIWLWLTVPVLTSIMVWRAAEPLLALAFISTCLAMVCTAFISHARAGGDAGVGDLFAEAVATGMHTVFGGFRLGTEMRGALARWKHWNSQAVAVTRGALLALPVLLIFGALFVSADAAFASLLGSLVNVELDVVMSHILLTLIFTWLAAGWLYWVLISDGRRLPTTRSLGLRAATLEVMVALGLVTALFVLFILVQSRYLFGGESLIQATTGLTYAEYARSGFFQLVAVAFLSLPLLLVSLWLVRSAEAWEVRRVRRMAIGIQMLLLIIMASALYRMHLYQEAYGLTYLRFLTTGFILWLFVIFSLFSATVLRGKPRWFTTGFLSSAFAAIILLAAANPDSRIVQVNVKRALLEGAALDVDHLQTLSADAVPAILNALPGFSEEDHCKTAQWLLAKWGPRAPALGDWRSWNYPDRRARALMLQNHDLLERPDCGRPL